MIKRVPFLFLTVAVLLGLQFTSAAGQPPRQIKETFLSPYDSNRDLETYRISPDGRHIAYRCYTDQGLYVVIDQSRSKTYESLGCVTFSPDSQRTVYCEEGFIILDGHEDKVYDEVGEYCFSPDSKHFIYSAYKDDKWVVVLDGNEEERNYDYVYDLVYSRDSRHLAYRVVDYGQEGIIDNPESTILDGKRGNSYVSLGYGFAKGTIAFSPNSNHMACITLRGMNYMAVLNGMEGKAYDLIKPGLEFGADGTLVFIAASRDEYFIVRNGVEGKHYKNIVAIKSASSGPSEPQEKSFLMSPDGLHLAYVAQQGKKQVLVIDGKEEKPYDEIGAFVFGSMGHFAYSARAGRKWLVVTDGQEGKHYGKGINDLCLSVDGRCAYLAMDALGKTVLVVSNVEQKKYVAVSGFAFSPDGGHFICAAKNGAKYSIYVDGQPGKEYNDILAWVKPQGIFFDADDAFHYIARNGDAYYLVEESLVSLAF